MRFVGRLLQDYWRSGSRRIYKITVPEDTIATRHLRQFDTWISLNGPMNYQMLEPMFLPPLNLGPAVFRKLGQKGLPPKRLLKYVKCAPNSDSGRSFLEKFLQQCILIGDTETSEEILGFLERDDGYELSVSLLHMILELPQKTPNRDKVLSRWWSNFEHLGISPDLKSYERRFETLLEDGRSDKISTLLAEMQNRGFPPTPKIWGIVFDCGVLDVTETLRILKNMIKDGETGFTIFVHALQAIERHFVMKSKKEAHVFLKEYIELLLRKFEFRIKQSEHEKNVIISSLERAFMNRDMHIVDGPSFPQSPRQQFITRYPHSDCLLNQLEYFFSENQDWQYGDQKQIRWQIRNVKTSQELQNVFLRFHCGFGTHESTLCFMKFIGLKDAEHGPFLDAIVQKVASTIPQADSEQIIALTNLLLSRQRAVFHFQLHDLIRRIFTRVDSLFEEAGIGLNEPHTSSIFDVKFLVELLKAQRSFALSSPKVLSRIAGQLQYFAQNDELDNLKPKDLSWCLKTMADFDFHHYPMCNALVPYLQLRIRDFNIGDLAVLAHSFARFGFSSNSIWPLVNNRINDFTLSKENFSHAVTLAWSLTMMDYFPLYTFLIPLFELWRGEILTEIRALEAEIGFEQAVNKILPPRTQLELWELTVNYQAKGHEQMLDDDLFSHLHIQYQALAEDHFEFCKKSPPHQQVSQILQRWGAEHLVGETVNEGFYVDIFVPKANLIIELPSPYHFSQNRQHVLHRGRRAQVERILKLCGYSFCKVTSQSGWKRLKKESREAFLIDLLKQQGCHEILNQKQEMEERVAFS